MPLTLSGSLNWSALIQLFSITKVEFIIAHLRLKILSPERAEKHNLLLDRDSIP